MKDITVKKIVKAWRKKRVKKCKTCKELPEHIDNETYCDGEFWESQHYIRCNKCGVEVKRFNISGGKNAMDAVCRELMKQWNKTNK